MGDVERVLAWFESGALVRPDSAQPSTVDLSCAIASLCGVEGVALSATAQRIGAAIGPAEHLIFVMVDGLGMNLVERLQPASFFGEHTVMEMQAVFPSSTAPALTSLATGRWPAQHAIPAWFTYLPEFEITATILPFIERYSKRPLGERSITTHQALPVASWLPRFGRQTRCYLPKAIAASAYSDYFSGGDEQSAYDHLGGAVSAIATAIEQANAPTYTYLYVPVVDAAEHDHGPLAKEVSKTLSMVGASVEKLAKRLRGRARIVVTADHGLTHVERSRRHELNDDDALLDLLRIPPFGEPRVPSFLVREGKADAFTEGFRARFGETHALLTVDEVDELRLLGPVPLSDETRRRMGDFMAISATADAVLYKPEQAMLGYHGGLLADEMRVPLIVA